MRPKVFSAMAPQQQAQLLMERAINHLRRRTCELIDRSIPSWYGQLDVQKGRSPVCSIRINANDLRLRAASWKFTLGGYNLHKSPKPWRTFLCLAGRAGHRAWLRWILGVLGNVAWKPPRLETVFLDRTTIPMKRLVPMPS